MGGAMTWVSERNLVAAISNAGGFGVIASGSMPPELLDAEIAATAALTSKPFGVNLITMHPQLAELIEVCVARRVGHVVLAGGIPATAAIQRLRGGGARVICFAPAYAHRPQARARRGRRDRHRGQRGRRPYRAGLDRGVGTGSASASDRGAGVCRRRDRARRGDAVVSGNGRRRGTARHTVRLRPSNRSPTRASSAPSSARQRATRCRRSSSTRASR